MVQDGQLGALIVPIHSEESVLRCEESSNMIIPFDKGGASLSRDVSDVATESRSFDELL